MGLGDAMGGLGAGIGAWYGHEQSKGDREEADRRDQYAYDLFRGLDPRINAQEAQAERQGPSAYDSMKVDSTGRGGMLEALAGLRNRYQSGGLDAQTKADIANVNAQAGQQAAAQRGAVATNAAQRGLGSSGASLAAARSAGQAAANTSSLAGMNALAMGEGRADAALQNYGTLSGGLQNYDYGAQANRASADDAISKFNAQNQTQNSQFNANQRQSAQQHTFDNSMGKGGAINGQADRKRQRAHETEQYWTGMGQASWGGAGGLGDTVLGGVTGGASNVAGGGRRDAGADWTQPIN